CGAVPHAGQSFTRSGRPCGVVFSRGAVSHGSDLPRGAVPHAERCPSRSGRPRGAVALAEQSPRAERSPTAATSLAERSLTRSGRARGAVFAMTWWSLCYMGPSGELRHVLVQVFAQLVPQFRLAQLAQRS